MQPTGCCYAAFSSPDNGDSLIFILLQCFISNLSMSEYYGRLEEIIYLSRWYWSSLNRTLSLFYGFSLAYKSALIWSLPLIWLVYIGLLRVSSLRSISPPFPSFSVCVSESVSPPSDWPELLFLLNGPRADWLPRPFRHAAEGAFLLEVSSCQRHM